MQVGAGRTALDTERGDHGIGVLDAIQALLGGEIRGSGGKAYLRARDNDITGVACRVCTLAEFQREARAA